MDLSEDYYVKQSLNVLAYISSVLWKYTSYDENCISCKTELCREMYLCNNIVMKSAHNISIYIFHCEYFIPKSRHVIYTKHVRRYVSELEKNVHTSNTILMKLILLKTFLP